MLKILSYARYKNSSDTLRRGKVCLCSSASFIQIQRCLFTTHMSKMNAEMGKQNVTYKVSSRKPLSQDYREFLSRALRVNQAGELAATLIYKSQIPPLVAAHPSLRSLMQHMYDQEAGHLHKFNQLIARHRVRPTAMYPVWTIAASVLGWGTAMMGREAAMACTEAIETEIGSHYNSQVRKLLEMSTKMKEDGKDLGPDLEELIRTIRRTRDEELEHLDHAVENDAKEASSHGLLNGIIRAGCRGAIWVSERV
ncbi:BgTH12-06318 [Blumeria graminis f. sp. triticale]|uniref:5-demethoxyubiquinone hydroxylase, mitochondrial n=1 Tax=Blumeria graminis f. sp. triticale TaxID=1689686 RepID=A0A9W4CXX9_BLUGR|nr:BgTH12-06318 [Blumeria graminis f. sp. triticale]